MVAIDDVEMLSLAGYLECGLGFGGPNHEFLIDLDYITRGGRTPFILALDANAPPEAWDGIAYGQGTYLEHHEAVVITATHSEIT